jgi:hypothetical protein
MPTCPKGHTSVAEDYCDECGAPIASAPSTVEPGAAAAPAAPAEACPECGTPRDGRFCEVCGHDYLAESGEQPAAAAPAPTPAPAAPAPAAWRVSVTADRAYYDRMQAAADADAEAVAFPSFCPPRRFTLTGEQMLIGRRSASRGIEPAIDLTGPPEDVGVSHAHALLVATPEGWSVVDLDSANGTYLDDATDQLPANTPTPLHAGSRVHIGAWTTLTVD